MRVVRWIRNWFRCRTARGRWLLRQVDVETAFRDIAARTLCDVPRFIIEVSRFTCARGWWRRSEEWMYTAQNPGTWLVRYLRGAADEAREEERQS